MNPIEIQKHVPVPASGPGRQARYPFKQMAVGDSFFIRNPDQTRLATVQQCASRRGKLDGTRFTVRKVTEGNQKGLRCWRVL